MSDGKKRINWLRLLRPLSLILVIILLLTGYTYAWMKREWTPTITQENIKIAAGSSLAFQFAETGETVDEISVNDLFNLGEGKEFEFKSVSNFSGNSDDFFKLDYSQGAGYERYENIIPYADRNNDSPSYYRTKGIENGYIEMTFNVISPSGEQGKKEIYITEESKIVPSDSSDEDAQKAVKAIRLSVTVHGDGNVLDETKIFASEEMSYHTAVTNEWKDGEGFIASGEYINEMDSEGVYKTDGNGNPVRDGELLKNATIYTFADFNEQSLFTLEAGETKTLTVRIWLEGADEEHCYDDVAGSELDLLLQFSAKTIGSETYTVN